MMNKKIKFAVGDKIKRDGGYGVITLVNEGNGYYYWEGDEENGDIEIGRTLFEDAEAYYSEEDMYRYISKEKLETAITIEKEKKTPQELIKESDRLRALLIDHLERSKGAVILVNGAIFSNQLSLKEILNEFKRTGVYLYPERVSDSPEKTFEELDLRIDLDFVVSTANKIKECQDEYYKILAKNFANSPTNS